MKKIGFLLVLLSYSCIDHVYSQQKSLSETFGDIQEQATLMLSEVRLANRDSMLPRTLKEDRLKMVRSADWTSGFFPGILWLVYEYTKDTSWKISAEKYTMLLEKEKNNRSTHDLGFMVYCSFGNGLRLTGNDHYRKVVIQAAQTLSKRFNSTAGVIKSWDNRTEWQYPVIIDNMMNLELLFAATRLTGDSSYYHIATTHANTTLKNHFRADNSSFHVLDYDTLTSEVTQRTTHQGYNDNSAWARGQAWGLYGFVMCYRETENKKYLMQAEKIADYIIQNPILPEDLVPYWDYNILDTTNAPRDASAAAITASALYELSKFSDRQVYYKTIADKVLLNLTDYYRSPQGKNKGFILQHSTGHKPANSEIDVPIIYADYYYVEALMRKSFFD